MFLISSGEPLESGDVRGDAGGDESSVLVAVRVRPLNSTERSQGDQGVLCCPGQGTILVNNGAQDRAFTFDAVFEAGCSQHEVFEQCGVKRLIDLATDGFSCTVFGFGQTGSGKTYTITGPQSLVSSFST
ncbi:kinesin-like protein KIF12 [Acipenser oxyrinchus oxyrinchus]|uniref:Kinesin-like protein KIF12 n=1 Tax=Acipenser oxyrinchus oxyrinchus TaxID=40147 RepID=A0AAD8CVF8_ACIOX|nr:kinesin-like protein KIF12 [Acipenser oxyrinchus oxyrinchus]